MAVSVCLRFSVLGPFTGESENRSLDLGPARQQAMLALLVLRAGEVIAPSEIVSGVWGEEAPASGERLIPTYIYRLRGVLELRDSGHNESGDNPVGLVRESGGYVLRSEAISTDLHDFETRVAEAERMHRDGRIDDAAKLLGTSLEIWRGEPLVGLPGPFIQAQRRRLVELRRSIHRERIELDLELGRHAELVPELLDLFATDTTREDIARTLMIALHRSGRRAEALDAYARARSSMVDQLGIEPSCELQRLQENVLHADLEPDEDAAASAPRTRRTPNTPGGRPESWRTRCDLPPVVGPLVGRQAGLRRAAAELSAPEQDAIRVHVVDGMPGVGKTAFAVRLASMLAEHYPDGQLCASLRRGSGQPSAADPRTLLEKLLRATGMSEVDIPQDTEERAAAWRACTAQRSVLLVLDDAMDAAQVQPLLPGGASSAVLVTSRRRLTGLHQAGRSYLDTLTAADAGSLLAELVGDGALGGTELDRVTASCGGLPLALSMVAAVLRNRPSWTPQHVATKLGDGFLAFDELYANGGGVCSRFRQSYDELFPAEQSVFRSFGADERNEMSAACVAARPGLSEPEAALALEALLNANLVQETDPEVFRMPDLLRAYAAGLAS